jgi:ATP-dependent protease Clp ATPase subunit
MIGRDQAKKVLSVAVHNHYSGVCHHLHDFVLHGGDAKRPLSAICL